jgi:hypothetical protein
LPVAAGLAGGFEGAVNLLEYFQKPHTFEQERAAADLIHRRNELRRAWSKETGGVCPVNPHTNCEISGSPNGDGDGGFRTPGSRTGAPNSAHREGLALDDYDPFNEFDDWLTTFDEDAGARNAMLALHGLYREHPDSTVGWTHLTTRPPISGRRTFTP